MDWLKHKKLYFLISGTAVVLSFLSLLTWGLKLGVDFRGGSIVEYKFSKEISTEKAMEEMTNEGFEINSVQEIGENSYLFRFPALTEIEKDRVASIAAGLDDTGFSEELRFETVGPSVGPELVRKTFYAVFVATGMILLWVAIQFKSFKFGVCAVAAMFYDSFILIGSFSALGHFLKVEVDFLFVTALLITLSFSVHDTIVVFDRIREINKIRRGDLYSVINSAITETMVRSLNNSFTIIFMLIAIILIGGITIRWFAVALLIGIVSGTFSSPFVASPLLASWDGALEKVKKVFFRKKP